MKNKNWHLLLIILAIGSILRLFDPLHIPFTHDEFSALFRTNFATFKELIEKGVMVDGHPAGIQVFLYYWTQLVGWSEFLVKLPFILMGIASIFLVYKLGERWFNSSVGIISASFMASLEYPIMYSQIARPYISGLFFCLLMVWFWHHLVFNPEKKFYRNALFFILTGSLCAYNHHFSLLLAFLVGVTGLIFIQKKYLLKYIISGVLIFVFYLPHWPVFFHQLSMGGVEGWLGKPKNDFFITHVKYIFQYSIAAYLMVAGLIIFGLIQMKKNDFKPKFLGISVAFALLPFLIGFFYSRHVSAVLQSSMLIFSFPFLLFAFFGHIPELNTKLKSLLIFIILVINIATLTIGRKYYQIFYRSFYEQFMIEQDNYKKEFGDLCYAVVDSHPKISSYYLKKDHLDSAFVWYDSFSTTINFMDSLKGQKATYCYFGQFSGGDPDAVAIIRDYFPIIIQQNNYFGGTSYLFSKKKKEQSQRPVYTSVFDCEKKNDCWSEGKNESYDSSISYKGQYSYKMDSLQEWSPTFTCKLNDIIDNPNNFIDLSVQVRPEDYSAEILLSASIESNSKSIHWGAGKLETYVNENTSQGEWVKVHYTIKLPDTDINHPNMILKVFVWNRGKSEFYMDDLEVIVRKGNPILYGLYDKI